MQKRRRFMQTVSLEERLAQEAERLREEAKKLPHGPEREILLRTAQTSKDRLLHERVAATAWTVPAAIISPRA